MSILLEYHYEMMFGLYKVLNITTRKSALIPISFLILVDDKTDDSVLKKKDSTEIKSLIRDQIIKNPSIVRELFANKNDQPTSNIAVMEYALFFKTGKLHDIDCLASTIIPHVFDNMIIEVYDESVANRRYFVYSANRQWNIRAVEYTLIAEKSREDNYDMESVLHAAVDGIFSFSKIERAYTKKYHMGDAMEIQPLDLSESRDIEKINQIHRTSDRRCHDDLNGSPYFPMELTEDQWWAVDTALYVYEHIHSSDIFVIGDEYTHISDIKDCNVPEVRSFILMSSYVDSVDPALSSIPLIEVTSIDREKDECSLKYWWTNYNPTYLSELGWILSTTTKIRVTVPIRNIQMMFHIGRNINSN